MSTVRIQIRRGESTDWESIDPVLADGEMGIEIDTNKVKVGNNGANWTDLPYLNVVPTDLDNTLGDYVLVSDVGNAGGPAKLDVDGNLLIPKSSIILEGSAANDYETTLTVTNPTADRTITFPDATGTVALTSDIAEFSQDAIDTALSVDGGMTKNYNDELNTIQLGINPAVIATVEALDAGLDTVSGEVTTLSNRVDTDFATKEAPTINNAIFTGTTSGITKAMVGLTNVDDTSDEDKPISTATQTALDFKLNTTDAASTYAPLESPTFTGTISGITASMVGLGDVDNTSDLDKPVSTAVQSALDDKLDISSASSTYAPLSSPTFTGTVSGITKTMVGLGNVDNTSDGDKPISSATQAALDNKLDSSTASTTYAPIANPTFTGTVSGITKSMVGLGSVDNTSDADKPVSTATQTALDLKADLAGPTFTGTTTVDDIEIGGSLTFSGTGTQINYNEIIVEDPLIYLGEGNTANINDLGVVASFNDGTYQHAGIVRDATDGIWKLFRGVTDEPTSTVNFAQATMETLEIAGIKFSDGTQTKEGVPSRTPIVSKTSDYTLTNLSERDSLIEVDSSSPVTITIPTNSAVAFPIGTTLDILGINTGLITIAGDTGVTVNATPGLKLRTQWSSCTLFKRGENAWVVYGDLKA